MFPYTVQVNMKLVLSLSGNATNTSQANTSLVDAIDTQNPQIAMIVLVTVVAFFIFVTVLGNTLVILAFIEDKRLRSRSNFFLLNLAICDFFIGAFCIPLYVPYMFTEKWLLGKFLCKLWLIVDNLMCTASAFNVVLISYDRFLSVTMAVVYRSIDRKHGQTVLNMALVWILASLLYSPAIISWEYFDGDKSISEDLCLPGYFYAWYFLLGASIFDFLLPLLSISFFNLSLYWNIRSRSRKKQHIVTSSIDSNLGVSPSRPYIISDRDFHDGVKDLKTPQYKKNKRSIPLCLKRCFFRKGLPLHRDQQTATNNVHVIKLSRDKKIAKSLSILVCVFGICWAPYSLLMTIRAACHDNCIASYWYDVTFWLLWVNSSINPFLYPLCHESFRKAFAKVMYKYIKKNSLKP
ncbi:hypothetical protein XELAEV_18031918mg [Xenopus laevis]|nr:hypothetical protein XELAEV_18031918mg [Xenopus laevis]